MAVVLALLPAPPAQADKPRLRLERIDTGRCAGEGEVQAHVVELELEGIVRSSPAAASRLVVDGRVRSEPPLRATTFAKTELPLHLALVIQTSPSYSMDLPLITAAARTLVRSLPARATTTIITYSWKVRRLLNAGSRARALQVLQRVGALETDEETGDLALVEAVKVGLRGLGDCNAGVRCLLVAVSDGLNHPLKRALFRSLGDQARRAGIPIHPIAFSPIDERGPLLNLGEIAKRSNGTLRWAQRPEELKTQLENLGQEVSRQQILTFRQPDRCQAAHRMQLVVGALRSNTVEVPAVVSVASAPLARWPVLAAVAGGGVALLFLAGLLFRWVLRRRRGRAGPRGQSPTTREGRSGRRKTEQTRPRRTGPGRDGRPGPRRGR